jgi:hypothetical protein
MDISYWNGGRKYIVRRARTPTEGSFIWRLKQHQVIMIYELRTV